jgi:2-haloacid dehalogenase
MMASSPDTPQVLLFDVNETLLDLTPLNDSVDHFLQEPGAARLWFSSLLHYSLVMNAAPHFATFSEIAAATLKMQAAHRSIEADDNAIQNALKPMLCLTPYPEVSSALARLKQHGYRLAALTNSAQQAVTKQLAHAGLSPYFHQQLSVESVGRYKPDGAVYRWAAQRMQAQVADCLLVAAHGWDIAGAHWAGMRTAFIARPGQQSFPLAHTPDYQVANLSELADRLT